MIKSRKEIILQHGNLLLWSVRRKPSPNPETFEGVFLYLFLLFYSFLLFSVIYCLYVNLYLTPLRTMSNLSVGEGNKLIVCLFKCLFMCVCVSCFVCFVCVSWQVLANTMVNDEVMSNTIFAC